MPDLSHPALYQINSRIWLNQISRNLKRKATLDDIPDSEINAIANLGFDWIYLLGVWQTGEIGKQLVRNNAEWRKEYALILPDLQEDDLCGSCFAITGYNVDLSLGGNAELIRLRNRLRKNGIRLMLDFIPNHTAIDHPWVKESPEMYVPGSEMQLQREPRNYIRLQSTKGNIILAHGRDPNFPGWSDTLQLNYGNPAVQEAMAAELANVAEMCDGVRCDMAMLLLPEVFKRTWGIDSTPFWPLSIDRVRRHYPDFIFLAEVYWDLEWTLQQQGFDYTYDKRLYDRLIEQKTRLIRDHLRGNKAYQQKLTRFLENHDERRAAVAFSLETHQAAAIIAYLSPGMRFFHQGQLDGLKIKMPVQLCRRPEEIGNPKLRKFYARLMECIRLPAIRHGEWQLIEPTPAWDANWTWDNFVVFSWQESEGQHLLVAVNYSPQQSQCLIPLPHLESHDCTYQLTDLMGSSKYIQDSDSLIAPGLYLDIPKWGYHVFEIHEV